MTAEVVNFTGISSLDFDPVRILEAAKTAGLTEVVICGVDADGGDYFASSVADAGQVTWHLERAKWRLMRQLDAMMEGEG